MPAKIFQAQLEKLFSNDKLAETEEVPTENSTFSGWMWECDQRGNITYCSPEIEQALGIRASAVVAQNLLSYRLSPSSTKEIAAGFFQDFDQPKNMLLSYQHQNGAFLPVKLYILGTWINAESRTLVRGFCQLQQPEETAFPASVTKVPADPIIMQKQFDQSETALETITQSAAERRKIEIAGQLIAEMLKHLKKTTQAIRDAQASRIHTMTEEQVVEDTAPGKKQTQVLFGKRIAAFPSITVTQHIHRLEWGHKLDLTDAEVEFLANNHHQSTGLFAKFRHSVASKTILKANKSWFEVIIQTESGEPPKILLHYERAPVILHAVDLNEFIADPLTLMPGLRQAVEHPFHLKQVLVRGQDFLIPFN